VVLFKFLIFKCLELKASPRFNPIQVDFLHTRLVLHTIYIATLALGFMIKVGANTQKNRQVANPQDTENKTFI
jgi:hypothetical protein